MNPLQPDFDPWDDTEAGRATERDDPFDDGSTEGPFGTLSEVAGVPRMSAGSRRPGAVGGSRTFTTGLTILLVVMAVAGIVTALVRVF